MCSRHIVSELVIKDSGLLNLQLSDLQANGVGITEARVSSQLPSLDHKVQSSL